MIDDFLPHVRTLSESGRAVVETDDDDELFDFVEDFLIERAGLVYEYTFTTDEPRFRRMVFGSDVTLEQVRHAISTLDPAELERVFRLNNPRCGYEPVPETAAPFFESCWEITDVSDPGALLRFVLDVVPDGAVWTLSMLSAKAAAVLRNHAAADEHRDGLARAVSLVLNAPVRACVADWWSLIDWASEPISQKIVCGGEPWLIAEDNLTCCWITKRVPRDQMDRAAKAAGFTFIDRGDN